MPLEIRDMKQYPLDELSVKLRITKDTFRAYLKNGKLKGKNLGRWWFVPKISIKEYFETQE